MLRKSWAFASLFVFSSFLYASLTTPPTEFKSVSDRRLGWKKDGEKLRVMMTEMDGHDYISVTQLAAVADAGTDWQPVARRVCLTRAAKSICFEWGHDDAIHYEGNVYLPLQYLLSDEFHNFSGTTIAWDEKENQFVQNSPVTLSLPPVENLGESYRLRVDVADGVHYELLQQDPRRIWLRFLGGRSAGSTVLEGDNVIHRIRLTQHHQSADVVMDLGGAAASSNIYFDEKDKKLVVEIDRQEGAAVIPHGSKRLAASKPVSGLALALPKERPQPVADSRIRTIVIDAGHGGHDAGAIGVRGTYEKDINLKVAKLLAERLSKEKNIRVILTRDSDEFVPLSVRTQIANGARADLFVSIHCNSSLSSKHSGLELYVLSPEATDEAADAVARLENSVVALETKKGENTAKLSTLLASMAVNNYINESLECAAYLGRAVKSTAAMDVNAIKEANFYVLRGAQMPSVLVELEYVSNPISELKLRSSRYQSQLAKALTNGLMDVDKRFRKKQESMASRAAKSNPETEQ